MTKEQVKIDLRKSNTPIEKGILLSLLEAGVRLVEQKEIVDFEIKAITIDKEVKEK